MHGSVYSWLQILQITAEIELIKSFNINIVQGPLNHLLTTSPYSWNGIRGNTYFFHNKFTNCMWGGSFVAVGCPWSNGIGCQYGHWQAADTSSTVCFERSHPRVRGLVNSPVWIDPGNSIRTRRSILPSRRWMIEIPCRNVWAMLAMHRPLGTPVRQWWGARPSRRCRVSAVRL